MRDFEIFAVILAGGSGTRFWPVSRTLRPKQLCKLGKSDKTMIELTLDRLDGFIPPENRIIVTHCDQADSTKKIITNKASLILAEPLAQNTANALALAAYEIKNRQKLSDSKKEAIMISLHADHLIDNIENFYASLNDGILAAKSGYLTLIGIIPNKPETGYGYIEIGKSLAELTTFPQDKAFEVRNFKEKPDFVTASKYIDSKNFLWNSGLFIWSVDTFLEQLNMYLPKTATNFAQTFSKNSSWQDLSKSEAIKFYENLENISVDHAILEKSKKIAVIKGDFSWQDIGSWDALSQAFGADQYGNYTVGDVVSIDSRNCTIVSDGCFIGALGIENLVVVQSNNAILVCPKDRAQDVKNIVAYLKSIHRTELT
ncbi:MAG: mannose-1-phosphate guanylyltransferase [Oligoflexales bacterium]|nr:mannose-1-phosphate guanylyltransferase [Oligoflexales bacterium]